jgi:hypothetical protein
MTATWWEQHYAAGGISGPGSRGVQADWKAEIVNGLIDEHHIGTVVEFGCGDSHQVSLGNYPHYLGLDPSPTAIGWCRTRFADDPTRRFLLLDEWGGGHHDMALSLDVVYHLLTDDTYQAHMTALFTTAQRLVVIFSTNHDSEPVATIRHRRFTDWTDRHATDWKRRHIPNPHGPADFHIYTR